jgi:imidazolonepropionase-like amidohydrolase
MNKPLWAAVGVSWVALLLASSALAKDVVIHAGHLIDGVSRSARDTVSIVIHDDRIVSVQAGFVHPPGAQVIDLSQYTVLPGLINCHVHLLGEYGKTNPLLAIATHDAFDRLLIGAANARVVLQAGFTSVRDVAGYTPAIVALKRGVASGRIPGPRMWVSGDMLSPTGGHGDLTTGFDKSIEDAEWTHGIVDSPEEGVRKVREFHRDGTDLIKIAPSGGVASVGDDPNAQLMTDAEIKAIVDTAHSLHMKVAAHAHGTDAINHAALLGVDSIEHGSLADENSYKIMKAHGVYLVPTLIAGAMVVKFAKENPNVLPPSAIAKALAIGPVMSQNAFNAYKAGVRIAFGTDSPIVPFGEDAREFKLLVDAGIAPMEAILTATSNAADLIGAAQDIGSVQPGRYADIIATRGDPLDDITELQHIAFVMKGGEVIKAPSPAGPAE